MPPSVSIIIPNYNGARFLPEAIDSALAQATDGFAVEVIVVDDGSTDTSREIIDAYGDRITALFQKNAGAGAARNVGWRAAQSTYIKFLDSDDRLAPGVLSHQLPRQRAAEADESKVITFTDANLITDNGNRFSQTYYSGFAPNRFFSAAELVQRAPITPMPLFPRKALEQVSGFNPALRSADEYDLEVRLQFNGWHFFLLDFVGYDYRLYESENRITGGCLSAEAFKQRYENYQSHLALADNALEAAEDSYLADAFARIFWETGRYAVRCGHGNWANRYFECARGLSEGVPHGPALYRLACRYTGPRLAERFAGWVRKFNILNRK